MTTANFLYWLDSLGFHLFLTGLSFIWQSSIVLVAASALLLFLRQTRASFRHLVILTILFAVPAIPLVSRLVDELGTPRATIPIIPSYSSLHALEYLYMQSSGAVNMQSANNEQETSERPRAGKQDIVPGVRNDSQPRHISLLSYPWALVAVAYGGGVLFLLLRILASLFHIRRLIHAGSTVTNPALMRLFLDAAARLGLKKPFKVIESSGLATPMTFGIIRHTIVLPVGLARSHTRSDLRAIALHELAHIRRGDSAKLLIASVIRALFFFHPLIWVAAWQVSLLAEQACDDQVLDITGEPLSYAKILASMVERLPRFPQKTELAVGMMFTRSIFYRRIVAILSENRDRMIPPSGWRVAFLTIVTGLSFIIACALPLGSQRITVVSKNDSPDDSPSGDGATIPKYNATAYAIPLKNVAIDGKLDDWPKDMIRYPIRNYGKTYGPSDIDDEDLSTSADLSPEFRVGFDPTKNLLYIAIEVRDDSLFAFPRDAQRGMFDYPDACEIYLDGKHAGKNMLLGGRWDYRAEALPGMQYVMAAPGDFYSPTIRSADDMRNPNLAAGDITKTKTKAVCTRNGDRTVFEWAIEVFDQYPDKPTGLVPGKTIGFDVVVVDRDGETDNSAWGCWAPFGTLKVANADLMGDLVLLDSYKDIGVVSGRVTDKNSRKGIFKQTIDIYRDDMPVASILTDLRGQFETSLAVGDYTLRPRFGHGYLDRDASAVSVKGGKKSTVDIALEPIPLSEALEKALVLYSSLKGYSDSIKVNVGQNTVVSMFLYRRPDLVRYDSEVAQYPEFSIRLISNGIRMIAIMESSNQYIEKKMSGKLSAAAFHTMAGAPGTGIVSDLLMSSDPVQRIRDGLLDAREVGSREIDGIPVTVVELTMLPCTLTKSVRNTSEGLAVVSLSIGKRDNLIHEATVEFDDRADAATFISGSNTGVRVRQVYTHRYHDIKLNPEISAGAFDFKQVSGMRKVSQLTYGRIQLKGETKVDDMTGHSAPAFELADPNGKKASSSDFKGKVVLIHFWATWSGACRGEIAALNKLQSELGSTKFTVIGIADDTKPEAVRKYIDDQHISYPVLITDEVVKNAFGGVPSVPMTFLIDRDNVIQSSFWGPIVGEDFFRKQVEKMIGK